jgi:hypothetical protein
MVIVTFDLNKERSPSYQALTKKFAEIGLGRTVKSSKGKKVKLPSNIYFGEYGGDKPSVTAKSITDQIKKAVSDCNFKGKVFVAVGARWGWRASKFKKNR